jgi:hypothetical protein
VPGDRSSVTDRRKQAGLGTSWTTIYLFFEQESAELLGIPSIDVTQAALIPVAYMDGLNFTPATREALQSKLLGTVGKAKAISSGYLASLSWIPRGPGSLND